MLHLAMFQYIGQHAQHISMYTNQYSHKFKQFTKPLLKNLYRKFQHVPNKIHFNLVQSCSSCLMQAIQKSELSQHYDYSGLNLRTNNEFASVLGVTET